MPKEYVVDYMAPHAEDQEPFRVMVGWTRDLGHVEIATINPNVEGTNEAWTAAAGLHVHLHDRRQVNDLIRYLRRARDQAFGRDE